MSKIPANMMTSAAHVKIPFAKRTIAKILMTIPISVRIFGWICKLARPFTMESTTRLPPAPIRPVMDLDSYSDLLIMHRRKADDLERSRAGRYFDFDRIAFPFVEQAAPNGRRRRYQTGRRIRVFARDQFVSDLLVLVDIEKNDFRTKRDSVSRNLIKIDHRKIRQPLFELAETNAYEILPLTGSLVIGVLAQVTESSRRFQSSWQFLAQFFFKGLNLFF